MHAIPTRFWLVLLIALSAYPALAFVVQQATGRSLPGMAARGSENQPGEQRRLLLSLAWLAALAAFTVFICSQAAIDFVHSPRFMPLLMAGCAAIGLYMAARGAITGKVEPLSRGNFGPYDRVSQPKYYWASMIWNTVFAAGCGFLIFKI